MFLANQIKKRRDIEEKEGEGREDRREHTLTSNDHIKGEVADSGIFQSHLLCKPLT